MSEYDQHKKVTVKRSSAGLGLFAGESIKKDAFVIEYTGEKITNDEADRRGGQYLFALDDTHTLDAKERKHTARYINHSCQPNCEAEHNEEEGRVGIRAARNIAEGEELTYDYGKEFFDEYIKPKGCRCQKHHKKSVS